MSPNSIEFGEASRASSMIIREIRTFAVARRANRSLAGPSLSCSPSLAGPRPDQAAATGNGPLD